MLTTAVEVTIAICHAEFFERSGGGDGGGDEIISFVIYLIAKEKLSENPTLCC